MSLRLLKILVNASVSTEVKPNVEKFFYVTNDEVPIGGELTIGATEFFDDAGDEVEELPALTDNNSYYNVYINGVLQMQQLSTYTPGATGSLVISLPEGEGPIQIKTPIVLEVVNYAPDSSVDVET